MAAIDKSDQTDLFLSTTTKVKSSSSEERRNSFFYSKIKTESLSLINQ